ncbi:hypothetical protein E3O42_00425 [Cryobacterium adonitolivorans]|uniref:Uncharacterized protein n=1 Tax=Cryobacterium adonitolivorans TaxID=1259189 RepID=A0A4R8WCA3_9MICO|nr:hypothetical protein [Cryobacterium adonitolivorans]TFC06893.1 hypothetical protein E3O42_00425 [Cryobacterium adonitolivorans]
MLLGSLRTNRCRGLEQQLDPTAENAYESIFVVIKDTTISPFRIQAREAAAGDLSADAADPRDELSGGVRPSDDILEDR